MPHVTLYISTFDNCDCSCCQDQCQSPRQLRDMRFNAEVLSVIVGAVWKCERHLSQDVTFVKYKA
jgi:hypothetical protein